MWSSKCNDVMARVQEVAFAAGDQVMPYVHILDLAENG